MFRSARVVTATMMLVAMAWIAPAGAYPIPVGTIDHATRSHDWEGVTGADPTAVCALAVDPSCDHFYLVVQEAMRSVTVGAARDDCVEGTAGCVPLRVRIYSLDATHTPVAEGDEWAEAGNVPAGSTFDVQVTGPSDAPVGLLPYLGWVRSCPAGQFCLPATGR